MGQSQSVSTEIEIQASPDKVRSVFMDFPRYKEWSKWYFEPANSDRKPSDLQKDDTLKVSMSSMTFKPKIVENTPDTFKWLGSLPLIFSGQHEFYWKPSEKNPGGTTMIQIENFYGLLAFLVAPGWSMRQSTLNEWNGFFADLKKEAEKPSS